MPSAFTSWHPTAEIKLLKERDLLVRRTRDFFYQRDFLEVETPILSHFTVTDPFLLSFSTNTIPPFFLQTSPEYHMKRLLAFGSGPIFQITKAFRQEEQGYRHNPEFTMLEWYRPGYNHHQLMDEMEEFLFTILNKRASRLTYEALFKQILDINPHTASLNDLKACADENNIHLQNFDDADKDTYLDLLLSHCIEPQLGQDAPVFIYNYPASQAALSVKQGNIGERFEVYYKGIELANGFHELTDTKEQRQRFVENLEKRQKLNLPEVALDEYFLAALAEDFPPSSGVALGLDRLIMLALNKKNIKEVMTFSIENA
jgi:lysyl-tRNA synthetase class 2